MRYARWPLHVGGFFDLHGYARVDFRVDGEGRPWILEVNANPCLSPDAGFAAALARADIPFHDAVARILDDALGKYDMPAEPAAPSSKEKKICNRVDVFGYGFPV